MGYRMSTDRDGDGSIHGLGLAKRRKVGRGLGLADARVREVDT